MRQKAADIGTLTHDFIEAHLRGTPAPQWPNKEMLKKAQRAFESWKEWIDNAGLTVEAFERPLVSEKYRFGGTIDARGKRGDIDLLVDWKTSKRIYPEYLAQLGGYAILLAEHGIAQPKGAIILRADKETDMTWDAVEVNHEQLQEASKAFLNALRAYHAREGMKSLLNKVSP